MTDYEPSTGTGEFWHPTHLKDGKTPRKCPNAGKTFWREKDASEVEPFMRKGQRRRNKRNRTRAIGYDE